MNLSGGYMEQSIARVNQRLLEVASGPISEALATITKANLSISESDKITWFDKLAQMSSLSQVSGKKFRARLSIAVSSLLNLSHETASTIGAFVELVQTASLVHDDVVDDATTRRGHQTVNNKFGNRFAVLTGDYIISQALNQLSQLESNGLISLFSKVTAEMTMGEAMEIECTFAKDRSIEHYLATIALKTASLMSFCTIAPCVIAKTNQNTTEQMADFGLNLGMMFQLVDDILDFTGPDGKKKGKDFEQGIMTHPMILLEKDDNFWEQNFENIHKQVISTGTLNRTSELAKFYCQKAKKNLEQLSISDKKDSYGLLTSIADSVIERLTIS
ncbi:MAG: polyprenyl synthetase family protein [Caldisericia bacterium]|nr:polyprenyl synthetase family protein [Caldisericia bacterium]